MHASGHALCYILKFGKKRDCDKTYDAIAVLPGHVQYTPPKQLKKQRKSKSDVKASKDSLKSPSPVPEAAAGEHTLSLAGLQKLSFLFALYSVPPSPPSYSPFPPFPLSPIHLTAILQVYYSDPPMSCWSSRLGRVRRRGEACRTGGAAQAKAGPRGQCGCGRGVARVHGCDDRARRAGQVRWPSTRYADSALP